MTDQELLQYAAKAAGINLAWSTQADYSPRTVPDFISWNPLTDDGDALRLSINADLCISHWPNHNPPEVMVGYRLSSDRGGNWMEPYGADKNAATRRAIVRAAAEIGRAMHESL